MPTAEKGGSRKEEPASVDALRQAIARAVEGGASLREIARRSGVHWGGVLRFSKGERDLKFDTAARLAEALGLEFTTKVIGRKAKR